MYMCVLVLGSYLPPAYKDYNFAHPKGHPTLIIMITLITLITLYRKLVCMCMCVKMLAYMTYDICATHVVRRVIEALQGEREQQ